jgi:hypothetical protein
MAKELMFYELAEGHFAEQVQSDFVEAQALAHNRGIPIKMNVEITIHPESRSKRGTGLIKFKSSIKAPAKESIEFMVEINKEGQIVDSGHRQGALHLEGGAV